MREVVVSTARDGSKIDAGHPVHGRTSIVKARTYVMKASQFAIGAQNVFGRSGCNGFAKIGSVGAVLKQVAYIRSTSIHALPKLPASEI